MTYLLILGVFPLLFSLRLVFGAWNAGQKNITWVGLDNIQRLLADSRFWDSFWKTLAFVALAAGLELLLGLAVALALQNVTRGKDWMRVAFAFPMLLPPIAVSFTWKMLFDYNRGPVNYFLENLGLDRVAWLAGQQSALVSLVVVDLWQWTPFIVLAALAALESLPIELYEAATVDGASRWDLLWQITLPLVQPYLVAIVLLRAIDAFKVFDTIYILTGGGPGTATEMLTFYAYVAGFRPFNMGFTATISWAIVIIMSIIFFLFLRAFRRLEEA
jgi:multiple sugar transport system permease protein